MSVMDLSPEKPKGGRPRKNRVSRNPLADQTPGSPPDWTGHDLFGAKQAALDVSMQFDALGSTNKVQGLKQALQTELHGVLREKMKNGATMKDILHALFAPNAKDPAVTGLLTKAFRSNGVELMQQIADRAPDKADTFALERMGAVLRREGAAIQGHLSRPKGTKISDLLHSFDLQTLAESLRELAPNMWQLLSEASWTPKAESKRRDSSLVFTTVCAMISLLRSQKANNFQAVISLFLLGSGASKREIEVFAHAGISLSYRSVIKYVKALSEEGMTEFRAVFRRCMCSIVWDNLNIAFRVESQRLDNKNHFDSGTTATLIPFTSVPHGTLPIELKPLRTSRQNNLDWTAEDALPSAEDAATLDRCLRWQVKKIALKHIEQLHRLLKQLGPCPEIDQILVHLTEQFPFAAMHLDESSLEGTIKVIQAILKQLEVTAEELKAHGLIFMNGDLLTVNLFHTVEGAHRNSDKLSDAEVLESLKNFLDRFGAFHGKMAVSRLVMNEHWGKPNSIAGGLWWENNTLLKRKPVSAGWKSKKAAPYFNQISSAGHVLDAFRIHCGKADFAEWASQATFEEFEKVADKVYDSLYTTAAYDKACKRPEEERDPAFENSILYNLDSLLYHLLVQSIKAGDIGRVVLVFRYWAVMMRTPKTMPKKFFLHNWLVNVKGVPNGFKEVDLLQEHQNFWAKVIYNAKGVNRSWAWLGMITVCIFALRDAMQTVHKTFNIPDSGTKHTVPNMTKEVSCVADGLKQERLQEHWAERPQKEKVQRARDLMEEGADYINTRGAFAKFTQRTTQYTRESGAEHDPLRNEEEEEEEVSAQEAYDVTQEDLEMDDEEPYQMLNAILQSATDMVDEMSK
ncbi:hypothetical protein FB45DRAFT_993941 [Roridomyces roridus]|uniref:DUF6589 domain-containing protein n=1 Tax=Roridomyces roridus TaxID=1738132 RepID=A0AAD7B0P4_9AGAR|nr:hypothetical protein FB45DRAFT_993941 [Roridomyces roridus]